MSDYRIVNTTRRVLKDGTIKGTIAVKERGRGKLHRVTYSFDPNKPGYSWFQSGANTEVLGFTVCTVERLCGYPSK